MPEVFTEAFVAVIFFHGTYRGSFHGSFFKASVEENYYLFSLIYYLLPRKLP